MKKEELIANVEKLRNELNLVNNVKVREDIENLLKDVEKEILLNDKKDFNEIEINHPNIVSLINKISDMLANIGI